MSVGTQIIQEGLSEALSTMQSMCANEGQTSVYDSYVVDAFQQNAQASPEDGWEDVDIGGYMDFMGEIVETGNQIMQAAYDEAIFADLLEEGII